MVHGRFLIESLPTANLHGETREFHDMNVTILCQILEPEKAFQLFSLSSKGASQEL